MAINDAFVNYAIPEDEKEKLAELGLESPEDCAFAFTSSAEAAAQGVGGVWLATRRSARAMTAVASASWRSMAGFQVQAKHGVSGVTAGPDITPGTGSTHDGGQLAISAAAGVGAGPSEVPSEVWPKARSQQRRGACKRSVQEHAEDTAMRCRIQIAPSSAITPPAVAATAEVLAVIYANWREVVVVGGCGVVVPLCFCVRLAVLEKKRGKGTGKVWRSCHGKLLHQSSVYPLLP